MENDTMRPSRPKSDSPSADAAEQRKRERKRQTDRAAQREHRKRQKLYVEQLEAQLSMFKASNESEASRLATQNIQLREQLKQMHTLWDAMEELLQRQRELRQEALLLDPPLDLAPSSQFSESRYPNFPSQVYHQPSDPTGHWDPSRTKPTDREHESREHHTNDPETAMVGLVAGDVINDLAEKHAPINVEEHADVGDTGHLVLDSIAVDPSLQHHDADFTVDPLTPNMTLDHWALFARAAVDFSESHAPPNASTVDAPRPLTPKSQLPSDITEFLQTLQPDGLRTEKSRQPDKSQNQANLEGGIAMPLEQSSSSILHWLWPPFTFAHAEALPLSLTPPLPGDKHLHAIIERATANMASIGPPNLIDFLIDNPKNTLSIDLKAFLAPIRKSRGTSEFLATYWVLYLLLRWQILRDEESYQSLPSWLRPTPLQLSVLHPAAADLIAWPKMREELIHMSFSDSPSPYDVSFDIGKYLSVQIQVGDLDMCNGPQRIAAQITNLSNWKLDSEFFKRYPQWKRLEPELSTGSAN